jgi:2-polyprenyl-6-methoxyphenol hydroxylase-like FAD-dependent oxidoreductase
VTPEHVSAGALGEHDEVSGRALVVGGGIGGLATALALQRAGWHVEVRERRTSPWDEGAGISLWPNALRALDALGVGDDVRAVGHANEAGGIRDRRGRWLARTDNAALARRHGDGILVLDRADLLRVLADALPAGVVRTGVPVDAPDAGPGDLVVGADGISSTTRALVDPDARSRSTGTVAWRLSAAVDEPPRAGGETWGVGAYAGVAPHRGGRVHLWAVVPAGEPAASDLDALRRHLAGWHAPIPELLERVDPATALVTELRWLPPLRSFVGTAPGGGRVVLLGDAAHAMTPNLGQGACLALEDAATLGPCLRDASLDEGLARYDRLRRPRTARLTRTSRLAGLVAGMPGRLPTALRDGLGRLAPSALTVRGLDGVLGWCPPD